MNPQSRGDLHLEGENQSASLPVEPSLVKSSAGFALDCKHVQLPPVTAAHGRKNPGSQTRRVSTRPEISKGGGSSANIRADLAFSGGTGGP